MKQSLYSWRGGLVRATAAGVWTSVVFAACSNEDWSDPGKLEAATAEARIIESVLNYWIQNENHQEPRGSKPIVLSTMQGNSSFLDRSEIWDVGWGDSATWDAYFAAIDRPLRIPPHLDPSFSLVSDFAARLGQGIDDRWYGGGAGFPHNAGFYVFGSLAVSPTGQEAIVHSAYVSCANTNWVSVFHLVSDAGVWRVAQELIVRHPDPTRMPPSDPDRSYG